MQAQGEEVNQFGTRAVSHSGDTEDSRLVAMFP